MKIHKEIKLLSINQAFQGKRYKTGLYVAYEQHLLYVLPDQILPKPPYEVRFEFGFSNKASDLDNPVKCLIDIMQKKYGFNDKDIYRMTIDKKIVKKGYEYFKVEMNNLT